jgi:acyl-CoA thioesterase-1
MRLSLFALLCVLPLSQGWAAQTITIAALGDSLTAGLGLAAADAFPVQLEKKLIADGYAVKIINDGVSGDTTAGGVARTPMVVAQKPAIVLIELGANDLLLAVPPAEIKKNFVLMMSQFRKANIRMFLIGQKAPFLTLGKKYADEYNGIYTDMAKRYDVPLYPWFLDGAYGNAALMQGDGSHPNPAGVAKIVTLVAPQIEKMLTKP